MAVKPITPLLDRVSSPADLKVFSEQELQSTRDWLYYRAASIYSGSNEVQRNIIAKRVLGLPD